MKLMKVKVTKKDAGDFPSKDVYNEFEKKLKAAEKNPGRSDLNFHVYFTANYGDRTVTSHINGPFGTTLTINHTTDDVADAKNLLNRMVNAEGALKQAISIAEKSKASLEKELKSLDYGK